MANEIWENEALMSAIKDAGYSLTRMSITDDDYSTGERKISIRSEHWVLDKIND